MFLLNVVGQTFCQSLSQTQWVFCTDTCHSYLASCAITQGWVRLLVSLLTDTMPLPAVSLFQALTLRILVWYWLSFPGIILYFIYNWGSVVANGIINGESLICSDIDITEYHPSHHDHSITCYVSELQKDAHLSHSNLLPSRNRLRSHRHQTNYYIYCIRSAWTRYESWLHRLMWRLPEELILPNTCQPANDPLLTIMTWILSTVWEILALCLAVRIAIKDFHGLPTGWTIGDCLTTLIKSHVLYFVS